MDYKLTAIEMTAASGMDAFFAENPSIITPTGTPVQAKVAADRLAVRTLQDLQGFTRVASDTLIHKSTQDFWSLRKDPQGQYFIERLLDGAGPVEE